MPLGVRAEDSPATDAASTPAAAPSEVRAEPVGPASSSPPASDTDSSPSAAKAPAAEEARAVPQVIVQVAAPTQSYSAAPAEPVVPPPPGYLAARWMLAPAPAPESSPRNAPQTGEFNLPPGYTLAAGVVIRAPTEGMEAVRRQQRIEELKEVDSRLAALRQARRIAIGGPVTAMVVGYSATLVSSAIALTAFYVARDRQHDKDSSRHDDASHYRKVGYAFSGAAALGLLTGILGTNALTRRLHERRTRASERSDLGDRLRVLHEQLDYSVSASPGQLQVGLQSSF